MIIGVDAAVLGVTDERLKVGVYHFVLNLLENLSRIDKKNKYLLYSFDPIPRDLMDKFDSKWTNLVLRPKRGWLTFRLSAEFLKNKPDIFLGLGQALPLYHPVRSIVFVYDLAFELYPQFYPDSYKRLSRQTKFAVKNCERIIAISNATKNDLVRIYDVSTEKINVIYPGVGFDSFTSAREHPRGVPQAQHHPWGGGIAGVSKPYFLFVGSYKPGKNIQNIIKAFELFKKEIKKPYRLVLAGSDYWGDVGDKEDWTDKGIKRLGYVKDEELARLYGGAEAFISPSYYEGFGMPILEAMASGVPVIASDCGSIPEIVGNAAILVGPDNIEGLKEAMMRVATDDKFRSQLITKGFTQAKKFSSEKSARQLLNIINNL